MRPLLVVPLVLALVTPAMAAELELDLEVAPARPWEVALQPLVLQLNDGRGNAVSGSVFASRAVNAWSHVQLRFTHRYAAHETGTARELSEKARVVDGFPVLQRWSLVAGAELLPLEGEISPELGGVRLAFGGVVHGGVQSRELWIAPVSPAFDDVVRSRFIGAGLAPVVGLGLGVRMQLGERVTLRAEVTEVASYGRLARFRGCTPADIIELDKRQQLMRRDAEPLSAGCSEDDWKGDEEIVPLLRGAEASGALTGPLLRHAVSMQLGVGMTF